MYNKRYYIRHTIIIKIIIVIKYIQNNNKNKYKWLIIIKSYLQYKLNNYSNLTI